jgi:hypothetical protein
MKTPGAEPFRRPDQTKTLSTFSRPFQAVVALLAMVCGFFVGTISPYWIGHLWGRAVRDLPVEV